MHMHMHISMGVLRAEDVVGCSIGPRRCTPASCAGAVRRQACERLSAGWRVPAEPTMLRLNSTSRPQCPLSKEIR